MTKQQYELNEVALFGLKKEVLVTLIMHQSARIIDLVDAQKRFINEMAKLVLENFQTTKTESDLSVQVRQSTEAYASELVGLTQILEREIKEIAGLPGASKQ
jgi:hypothetical protein